MKYKQEICTQFQILGKAIPMHSEKICFFGDFFASLQETTHVDYVSVYIVKGTTKIILKKPWICEMVVFTEEFFKTLEVKAYGI